MALGVVIINPTINANAQAPGMTLQQSNTDKQATVTIQKNRGIKSRSLYPSDLFLCPKWKFGTSASNGTTLKN
jgi:hypothetical protein